MNRYLSAAELKDQARGTLLVNLGTVVGAFLVHMACYFPVWLFASFTPSLSIIQILFCAVSAIVVSIYNAVLTLGENFVVLSASCGMPASVSDVFYAFRNHLVSKVAMVRIIPEAIITTVWMVVVVYTIKMSEVMPDNDYLMGILQSGDYETFNTLAEQLFPYSCRYLGLLAAYLIIKTLVNIIFSQTLFFMLDYPDEDAMTILSKSISLMRGHWGRYFYMQLSFILWYLLAFATCYISMIWTMPYMRVTYANFYLDLVKNKGEDR